MCSSDLLDLRRNKDVREVITCEVEPSLLADLEAIGGKERKSHEKRRITRSK